MPRGGLPDDDLEPMPAAPSRRSPIRAASSLLVVLAAVGLALPSHHDRPGTSDRRLQLVGGPTTTVEVPPDGPADPVPPSAGGDGSGGAETTSTTGAPERATRAALVIAQSFLPVQILQEPIEEPPPSTAAEATTDDDATPGTGIASGPIAGAAGASSTTVRPAAGGGATTTTAHRPTTTTAPSGSTTTTRPSGTTTTRPSGTTTTTRPSGTTTTTRPSGTTTTTRPSGTTTTTRPSGTTTTTRPSGTTTTTRPSGTTTTTRPPTTTTRPPATTTTTRPTTTTTRPTTTTTANPCPQGLAFGLQADRSSFVFDGQSNSLSPRAERSYARKLMQQRWPDRAQYSVVVAVGGTTFRQRDSWAGTQTDSWIPELGQQCAALFQEGGPTELAAGMSASELLEWNRTYTGHRRSAGFDVIVGATIPPSTAYTPAQDAERLAYNDLLRHQWRSVGLDRIIDVASIPELQDPADTRWYSDGLHFTDAASTVVAGVYARQIP